MINILNQYLNFIFYEYLNNKKKLHIKIIKKKKGQKMKPRIVKLN